MSTATQPQKAQTTKRKKRHKKSHRLVKSIRYFVARRMLSLFSLTPALIPLTVAHKLCTIAGRMGYYFPGTYQRQAMANLRLAFGKEKSPAELNDLAQKVGVELTKTLFEFVYSMNPRKGQLYTSIMIEGREHLDEALRRGKGVLAITAHLGNFFVIEGKLLSEGYPFCWLLKLPKDKGVSGFLETRMAQYNLKFILAEATAASQKEIVRCLRRNEIVGITLDQDQKAGGIPLKLMGQEVSVAPGPAVLARRTDATILPLFIIRQHDNTHKIIIEPPIEKCDDISHDEAVVAITVKLAQIIESYIHQYPTLWYWATKPHRHPRHHPRLRKVMDRIS